MPKPRHGIQVETCIGRQLAGAQLVINISGENKAGGMGGRTCSGIMHICLSIDVFSRVVCFNIRGGEMLVEESTEQNKLKANKVSQTEQQKKVDAM